MINILKKLSLPLLAGVMLCSPAYAAFEGLSMMRMGAWEVDFSGNVNGFATALDCDAKGSGVVAHGLACGSNGTDRDVSNVQTGLLPSWFNFAAATTTDGGIRTGVHLSFQPGIDTNSALGGSLDGPLGLGSSNFRQVFLTWGSDSMGTFKIGRDLGLYGSNAILNDMTLLGVGTISDLAANGGNTTLGRIGVGYLYADWKSQIQYASPNWNGFSFTVALVDPWGVHSLANQATAGVYTNKYSLSGGEFQEGDTYGLEGKINYAFDHGNVSGDLWASFIKQEVDFDDHCYTAGKGGINSNNPAYTTGRNDAKEAAPCDTADNNGAGNDSADATGFDFGAKIVYGDFDFVGYFYDGEGIGTTGFLVDGIDITGDERDSDGYYVQARYRIPTTGTVLGISVGESNLDQSDYDKSQQGLDDVVANHYNLVETNESFIFGIYHPIGEALSLVAEFTETEAEAHNGNEAEEQVIALGAIMFF